MISLCQIHRLSPSCHHHHHWWSDKEKRPVTAPVNTTKPPLWGDAAVYHRMTSSVNATDGWQSSSRRRRGNTYFRQLSLAVPDRDMMGLDGRLQKAAEGGGGRRWVGLRLLKARPVTAQQTWMYQNCPLDIMKQQRKGLWTPCPFVTY